MSRGSPWRRGVWRSGESRWSRPPPAPVSVLPWVGGLRPPRSGTGRRKKRCRSGVSSPSSREGPDPWRSTANGLRTRWVPWTTSPRGRPIGRTTPDSPHRNAVRTHRSPREFHGSKRRPTCLGSIRSRVPLPSPIRPGPGRSCPIPPRATHRPPSVPRSFAIPRSHLVRRRRPCGGSPGTSPGRLQPSKSPRVSIRPRNPDAKAWSPGLPGPSCSIPCWPKAPTFPNAKLVSLPSSRRRAGGNPGFWNRCREEPSSKPEGYPPARWWSRYRAGRRSRATPRSRYPLRSFRWRFPGSPGRRAVQGEYGGLSWRAMIPTGSATGRDAVAGN
jgi:hypothetical protein